MRLDFLIIADKAEAVNGKLYLMGGGWDRLAIQESPGIGMFDVAFGVIVGYNETNVKHKFSLGIEDEDNVVVLGPLEGEFEVGRPPGLMASQEQRFIGTLKGPFRIPSAQEYHWALSIDSHRFPPTSFRVGMATGPQL